MKCPHGRCDGSGRLTIKTAKGYENICCDCMPSSKSCGAGHIIISFRHDICPLCVALSQNNVLRDRLRSYRGNEKTTVQRKTEEGKF